MNVAVTRIVFRIVLPNQIRAAATVDCAGHCALLKRICIRSSAAASLRVNFPADVADRALNRNMACADDSKPL